jgi:dTMP kinase
LITFEGLDRVGKSTQVKKLIEHLERKKIEPVVVREPGSTDLSERIREILKDPANIGKISSESEFLLYSAARAQLVGDVIKPALEAGRIVISDRFYDSSTAYQGFGRGLDIEFIKSANMTVTGGIIPDLTILLVINTETAVNSKKLDRFNPDLFDDRLEQEFIKFRGKVQEGFLKIAGEESDRFLVIDSTETIGKIAKSVKTRVDMLLKANSYGK